MVDYTAIKTNAARLIAKFGQPHTFRAKGSVPDPVTGLGGSAGAAQTLNAVKIGVNDKNFPETLIEAGDIGLIVESGTLGLSDVWVNGGADWSIVSAKQIAATDEILAVKILARA